MISCTLRISTLVTFWALIVFSQTGMADPVSTPHRQNDKPVTTLSGSPLDGMTLAPGDTVSFQIDGDPSKTRVSTRPNPISGLSGTLRRDGDTYRFTAPLTGAFAGPYPIDISTPDSGDRTVRLRVPPVARVESPILLAGGDPLNIQVQGLVPGYQFQPEALEVTSDAPSLKARSLALEPASEANGQTNTLHAGSIAALPEAGPGRFRIRLNPQDGRYEPVIVDDVRVVATEPVEGRLHAGDGHSIAGARLVVSTHGASSSATTDDHGRFRLMSPSSGHGEVRVSGPGLIPRAFDLQTFRQKSAAGPITMAAATAQINAEILGLAAGDRIEVQLVTDSDDGADSHGPVSFQGDGNQPDTVTLAAREGVSYEALRVSGKGYRDQEVALSDPIMTSNGEASSPPVVVQLQSIAPEITIGDISINRPQGEHWGTPDAVVTVFVETAGQPGTVTIRYGTEEDDLSITDDPVSYRDMDGTAAVNVRLHPLDCGTQYYGEAVATNDLDETSEVAEFDFRTAPCTGSDPSTFSCSLTSGGTGSDPIPLILILISIAGLSMRSRT